MLETSNTPKVYGHSFAHGLDFTFIPKAELFVESDTEIDIVAMSSLITTFSKPGNEFVKGTVSTPNVLV